jgi:hypothetical protein
MRRVLRVVLSSRSLRGPGLGLRVVLRSPDYLASRGRALAGYEDKSSTCLGRALRRTWVQAQQYLLEIKKVFLAEADLD